jgi:eukaryotic-like serine/threonine-protein kinase
MASKHIDINYRDSDGRWRYEKVWFPEETFVGASGTTYRLGRYVNKGSNGTLFQCQSPAGETLAVKFLHQLDSQRLSRFEFEALVLADLQHSNVLRFVDGGDIATTHAVDVPFIVTELFLGNLEYQVTSNGPLDPADVRRYGLCLFDALEYIHERGIIHRDIKPSNIFLSAHSGAVLGDFGIAKTSTDAGAERYYRQDVTLLSEFVGPVLWLSPELAAYSRNKAQDVDHRSDLFQVGLVLWYLLTGEIPRGGLDEADDPTGGKFFGLVQALTKQRPERRFPSARAAAEALRAVQA